MSLRLPGLLLKDNRSKTQRKKIGDNFRVTTLLIRITLITKHLAEMYLMCEKNRHLSLIIWVGISREHLEKLEY